LCYEKLGRIEAQKAYEVVLAEYADQTEFTARARERLAALTGPVPTTMTARRIENPPADAPGCHISPDGRYITFTDWKTGNLAVQDLQTGKKRLLTDEGTEGEENPEVEQSGEGGIWSSDGKEIAYVWFIFSDPPRAELRIVGIDSGKPRIISGYDDPRDMGSYAWSPNGKHIAASLYRKNGPPDIVLISTDDGSMRVLTSLNREIFPTTKIFSPDSQYIAYDRLPDEMSPERDIFLVPIETGQEIPLIQHPADDYLLGWSQDGKWIVFASDRTGALGLWIAEVSGVKIQGEPKLVKPGIERILPVGMTREGALFYGTVRVAEDVFAVDLDPATGKAIGSPRKAIEWFEGGNFDPSYSPDGKHLAYISRRGNSPYPTNVGNALCVRSLDKGEERVFFKEIWKLGLRHIAWPEWSPDGRSIVFRGSEGNYPSGLYNVDLETDRITLGVGFGPDERNAGAIYGPDETYFFLRANVKEGFSQIVQRDIKSGDERELYRNPKAERTSIALSPDGRWLSFANTGWGGVRSLKIMPASGGEAREIWNFGEMKRGVPGISHIWAPDGESILFGAPDLKDLRVWNLWRVAVKGGKPPEKMGLQTRWGLWGLSVHPSGRKLIFASRSGPSSDSELWVLENFLPQDDGSK
jgi:Tol biopolymer transport system component